MELTLKTATKTITSEGITSSKMGVDNETADMLTYYLRDKIYSNKILAPIREYICNALDAHVESGSQKDVEVKIVKFGSSYEWSVRDYGTGLDEDDIRNVFGIYGKSSKRNTNKLVGSFGVGAMSAFSYTDSFNVTSHHNGVKTVYLCSLGAGDFGVEVGEIHRISEEPTMETGILVSFDITNDWYSFNLQTCGFVKSLPHATNIAYKHWANADIVRPDIPVYSYSDPDMAGVTYHIYGDASPTCYVLIRMGGVIYKVLNIKQRFKNRTIVDIPIGSMSIPISREAFEENIPNNKYLEKILDGIERLEDKERSELVPLSLWDFIDGLHTNNKQTDTNFFSFSMTEYCPDQNTVFQKFHKSNYASYTDILKQNKVVYIIPNIKSINQWHKRLDSWLVSNKISNGYVYILENRYDEVYYIIDSLKKEGLMDIVFIHVKSLKLPKLQTNKDDKKQYAVTRSGFNYTDYYTPEELENSVNEKYPIDWDSLSSEFWNKPDLTESELLARSIGLNNVPYGAYRCNSTKFVQSMVELGWVDITSQEYRDARAILAEIRKKEMAERDKTYWAESFKFKHYLNPKTVNRVMKNFDRNSKRMNSLFNKLASLPPTSLRNKLVRMATTTLSSYSAPLINRQEYRKLFHLPE